MSTKKTALITGSTSGIGLGIAKNFAAKGMNIILNGFGDAVAIEEIRSNMSKEFGVEVRYSGADMSKVEEIENMIKTSESEFGAIDVLVNNAGIQHVSPVEDFPVDKWNAIIAINLSASFHTIRMALPKMKEKGWGRIINIASAHALVASPYKTVALETATFGITMNAICPGYVWTPLVEKQVPDTAKARGITEEEVINNVMLHSQPTKKFVTIDQVAALASYLASDDAASITGSMVSIDGGWSAQ